MGTQPAGRGDLQRRMWLVPIKMWLKVEDIRQDAGYKRIPYSSDTTNRKVIVENGLTAVNLLEPYELTRVKGGWAIPDHHIFQDIYFLHDSVYKYSREDDYERTEVAA